MHQVKKSSTQLLSSSPHPPRQQLNQQGLHRIGQEMTHNIPYWMSEGISESLCIVFYED